METRKKLEELYSILERLERFRNVIAVLSFDSSTICPEMGREYQDESATMINMLSYELEKGDEFTGLVKDLYAKRDELDEYNIRLIETLYEDVKNNEKLDPELFEKACKLFDKSYRVWLKAKQNSSYEEFEPTLKECVEMQKKLVSVREFKKDNCYDTLLSDFEKDFTQKDYDEYFNLLKEELIPLIQKVKNSKKKIRTDFLSRSFPIQKQEEFSQYLMDVLGFDKKKGVLSTTEHPFTNSLSRYDTRITTHYYENQFISNMYSVIHETGHAIFGQNEPDEIYNAHLQDHMSMGMHESVSRFYENRIGRSKEFIHLIYPKLLELFKEQLSDVSEEELYLAVNAVDLNNPIRTEADELTYSMHIIIRYELEKEFINNDKFDFKTLNKKWNELYEKYLGIKVKNDKEGVLQDVHWTNSYGYFATYAIGNAYNSMYIKEMEKELDIKKCIANNEISKINEWMKEHVFKKASLLKPKEWIKDITSRSLDGHDFVDYLKAKYKEIYDLD